MDKDTWEMDDYRKMATMAQFMLELQGQVNRYATRKDFRQKQRQRTKI
jgi:hypothetical protein